MTYFNNTKTRKCICLILTLAALLMPSGCASEEKTMLLPTAQPSEEEIEIMDPDRDFTVKKIYAYTYETRNILPKSAFLQGCSENEIHIAALDELGTGNELVYRQVDYRYGFYDTIGAFFRFWEELLDTSSSGEMAGDLYLEKLLPSPDGTQLLVYVRSAFWDNLFIWLYTIGRDEPWLLYEGVQAGGSLLKGSFSPDGNWVTFDVAGSVTGDKRFVPVYDCRKSDFYEDASNWWTVDSVKLPSRFYYPDKLLYAADSDSDWLLTADLYETSDTGAPCLLSFILDSTDGICVWQDSLVQEQPDSGENTGAFGEIPPADSISHVAAILYSYEDIPYFQYRYMEKENILYYIRNTSQLCRLDMTGLPMSLDESLFFPDLVWDFLPLDSGDLLAVLVQESGTGPNENAVFMENIYADDNRAHPYSLQRYWDIRSGDLYLFPADGSDRRLLYKNVQNLLSLEYDPQTRRILLETYEDETLSHRRCIILEL